MSYSTLKVILLLCVCFALIGVLSLFLSVLGLVDQEGLDHLCTFLIGLEACTVVVGMLVVLIFGDATED